MINLKKINTRNYQFNPNWISSDNADYKEWISKSSKGNDFYHCNSCNEDLKINTIWGAHAHQFSKDHKDNVAKLPKSQIENEPFPHKIIRFEIKLAHFVIQNHLSFATGEKILKFMKDYCHDYNIIKDATLSSEKISNLIKDCVTPTIKEILDKKLLDIPFSVSIDETTHKFSKKTYLGVMIEYFDQSWKIPGIFYLDLGF